MYLIIILVGIVHGASLFFLNRVNMAEQSIGNPVLFYYTGISLVCVTLALCYCITWSRDLTRILSYVGRRSLLFMCWSVLLPGLKNLLLAPSFAMNKTLERVIMVSIMFAVVEMVARWSPLLSGRGWQLITLRRNV